LTANNNVICANDNADKSHVTPVKVFPPPPPLQQQPQLAYGVAVTSSSRCEVAVPGLLAFNHAQPIYYNQAQCVPLYGQYPGQ